MTLVLSFGIDLTSGETKPSACVVLNERREIVFHDFLTSNDRIVSAVQELSPAVIAIDAPLGFPDGLCCLEADCSCIPLSTLKGRECERMLAREAIPCYFTTKRSIIKHMVYRGIRLESELRQHGFTVIEAYPFASKRRLFGGFIPKKSTASGIAWLRNKIDGLVLSKQASDERWNHDLCDAAIAAYTGLLFLEGTTQALGNGTEGYIHIPRTQATQPAVSA